MPYRTWITISVLTPLFFRYHLPLIRYTLALEDLSSHLPRVSIVREYRIRKPFEFFFNSYLCFPNFVVVSRPFFVHYFMFNPIIVRKVYTVIAERNVLPGGKNGDGCTNLTQGTEWGFVQICTLINTSLYFLLCRRKVWGYSSTHKWTFSFRWSQSPFTYSSMESVSFYIVLLPSYRFDLQGPII